MDWKARWNMGACEKLNESDQRELLHLARSTLQGYLANGTIPEYHTSRSHLRSRRGVFVSLHRGEDLRGCIGRITPDRELHRIVQECAISAAVEDARFRPVTRKELDELTIEISVLTPFRRVGDLESIEIGRHGLYISQGIHRGLLLPQVASQYGWDRETFLAQTCRKAGLPERAWMDSKTMFQSFEAQVFSEGL